jgi:hypothetical protein
MLTSRFSYIEVYAGIISLGIAFMAFAELLFATGTRMYSEWPGLLVLTGRRRSTCLAASTSPSGQVHVVDLLPVRRLPG